MKTQNRRAGTTGSAEAIKAGVAPLTRPRPRKRVCGEKSPPSHKESVGLSASPEDIVRWEHVHNDLKGSVGRKSRDGPICPRLFEDCATDGIRAGPCISNLSNPAECFLDSCLARPRG
ncbi:uncharacterized protein SPSK_02052 [Sporothrix schenckii 1099-18]|uniref:Uncharacterized protein n=1 Tax=Sporothrix schenckii 1099-18 TaxID=1397361 RepID=A0A0F2MDP3_SPOSC|nr:uncharacterized protein SPSK_02052 [Sporothrix schenckii 1099-18]KJR86950.1 hypothetical protein SPSK_02052 [Sporothrix schenckii 1099-18]